MNRCKHWEQFRDSLLGRSTKYKLTMMYWYWGLSDVACVDCSFEDICRRILYYLQSMATNGVIVLPTEFRFELNWDEKLEVLK
jgi:hypothetical protein